jgi:hypothetical protein
VRTEWIEHELVQRWPNFLYTEMSTSLQKVLHAYLEVLG